MKKLTKEEIKLFFQLRQRMMDELELGAETAGVVGIITPTPEGSFKWYGERAEIGEGFKKEIGEPLERYNIY